jgi:curved DNA-binding protein
MQRDYYRVLGVGPDADEKQIKKAYRSIIRYCHPDSPDCRMTKDELLEVQEAYETLADPEKRARYDRGRRTGRSVRTGAGRGPEPMRQAPGRGAFHEDDPFADLFSFFRDPFFDSPFEGRGRRDFAPERELEITLSRAEARRGGLFEVAVPGPGGIPAGTIVVRIAPGVRSGTETTVDLSGTLGARQRVRITIVVEDDGR